MKTKILFIVFFSMTILYSCNSKPKDEMAENMEVTELSNLKLEQKSSIKFTPPVIVGDNETTEEFPSAAGTTVDNSSVNKKIIKDGKISIKTNDISESKKGIDALVKKLNGYYETEDLVNDDNSLTYIFKIRIPANNLEQLISNLENGKDKIESKSIQTRDITEEYVDIESRLTNKREYLKRYKDLLSKASTVKDILAIEEQIRVLQEEIESKEGRLKYLNDQIAFSTLELNLYKEKEFIYEPQQQDKFVERVKNSLSNGWRNIIDFILWSITVWPLIIFTIVLIFTIKRINKKRKIRKSKQ